MVAGPSLQSLPGDYARHSTSYIVTPVLASDEIVNNFRYGANLRLFERMIPNGAPDDPGE